MAKYMVYLAIFLAFMNCQEDSKTEIEWNAFNLLMPAGESIDVSVTPVFSWEPAGEGIKYRLVVSKYENLTDPVIDQSGLSDTEYSVKANLNYATKYFWSVFIVDDSDKSIDANENSVQWFRTEFRNPEPSPEITKYFISPVGEDSPLNGTEIKPFKTLAYASKLVPPAEGDTLYLLNGEYIENEPVIIPLGVNVSGESKDGVIISSSVVSDVDENSTNYKNSPDGSIIQLTSSYKNNSGQVLTPFDGNQFISDITLDGNDKQVKAGLWVQNRKNISVSMVVVKNTKIRGLVIAAGEKAWYQEPEYYLTGIEVSNCIFENCGKDLKNESTGNLCLGQLDGADITNITINDNEGYGIKFMYDGYFKNCSFSSLNIFVNEKDNLWGEDISIELWNLGPGNVIENVESNTWLSLVNHPEMFSASNEKPNLILKNSKITDADGMSSKEGIELGLPHAVVRNCFIENKGIGMAIWNMGREDITIHNNIFTNSSVLVNWAGGSGIYIDNSKDWVYTGIRIFNNVFDKQNYAITIKGKNLGEFQIKNNLIISSNEADIKAEGGSIYFSNNYKYTSEDKQWIISGDVNTSENYLGNPEINLKGEKSEDYYSPSGSNSPLIDAGEDVGLVYEGAAPDIGFVEYKE
ncbi:MAG: hypothetical protein HC906_14095 [Bacteroidales bacterium]|nr:hypothetical protein [Bacteroidales bacterium]